MAYVQYNSNRQVKDLNLNDVHGRVSVLPAHMYAGEAFHQSKYLHEWTPRDSRTSYIYPEERKSHPDHFSRFARYSGCMAGYCLGNHPGKYEETVDCSWKNNQPPQDMAPERFYRGYQLNPFNDLSNPYYRDAASRDDIPVVTSDIRWVDYWKR